MTVQLSNSVKYLRGVGPQRAAMLEERGIVTVADLLGYLPFRYEDRMRFTPIAEIIPGQVHTILAEVVAAGGTRAISGRGAPRRVSPHRARRFRDCCTRDFFTAGIWKEA